jgi:hypothetical protein
MAEAMKRIKVWFDREGDFLEVTFADEPGFMRETESEDVMQRVNAAGAVIGFSIMNVSRSRAGAPIVAELPLPG